MTVKRLVGLRVRFGGEEHSGWLPAGAARPKPTTADEVTLTLEISTSDSGFILEWWNEENRHVGDTWHESEREAMRQAELLFGATPAQWEIVDPQQATPGDTKPRA